MNETIQIKTTFEKLVIAKQYINYLKKRVQEAEDKVYNNEILIEEMKLEKICYKKENKVSEFKNNFINRFAGIEADYGMVKDFIEKEIEPKSLDSLLHLYYVLNNTKIRVLKKTMKRYYEGYNISIGKCKFSKVAYNHPKEYPQQISKKEKRKRLLV